ncbi:cation-translocating P-type ATPase [candidate division KSB1 bacterium]|nr:cation-translocating P-type ATPase [candidate division KSB1 bacterium]
MNNWHQIDLAEVLNQLGTEATAGLNAAEAKRRLAGHGLNELVERGLKSPWRILWEQLTSIMVVILIIAAAASMILRDYEDAAAILVIVILNALLGVRQEYQAEQAIAALKKLAVPNVKVRRDGHVQEISARELVPGDVVILEAGNLVPADCRVLESAELRIQEATLTGESEAVEKHSRVLAEANLPLGDRRNMAYMGTVVSYGRGQAVVTATGMKTELGSIAEMIQTVPQEPTPMQRRLSQLGRIMAGVALALVGVIFILGLFRGDDLKLLFLTGVSMAVAAVPEGLPAVVTIALALGAQRMLKRWALIRKLPAVETLGSVTVICSDKTGTLTENRMTVTVVDIANHEVKITEELRRPRLVATPNDEQIAKLREQPALALMAAGGTLCNDALLEIKNAQTGDYQIIGDPTEGALLMLTARLGISKGELTNIFPRIAEAPFDSERKRMTTVHKIVELETKSAEPAQETVLRFARPTLHALHSATNAPYIAFTKGAVDGLLEITTAAWVDKSVEPLSEMWRQRIIKDNERLAKNGMRVLGIAFRPVQPQEIDGRSENFERDLIFVGMVGMIDPARPEVKDAVSTCKRAGIRPVMITGDHPLTAQYIARDLGIAVDDHALTGQDLARMPIAELEAVVEKVSVYARVSPEHKLKIVQALQNRGHIVAMTGDGVNDAPALKKADIGVAMGITGTDVSKEAADMVLQDDNFATIVAAVEQGRVIYDNIRKFIKYILASNFGEILVMLLAPFFGMPLPLLPLQILWINLVTDGLPGLALSVEPAERDTMRRPPYPPAESIFGRGMGRQIIFGGLVMGLVSLGVGYWYWRNGDSGWQTMVFATLTFAQMANVLAIRAERASLFSIALLSNKPLLGAVILTFVLQLAVIYVPFLKKLFATTALSATDLALSLALSTFVFFGVELQKWLIRRRTA